MGPIVVAHPTGQVIAIPSAPAPSHALPVPPAHPTAVPAESTPGPQPTAPTAAADLTAEFEKFAECMQKTLAEEEEEECWQAVLLHRFPGS